MTTRKNTITVESFLIDLFNKKTDIKKDIPNLLADAIFKDNLFNLHQDATFQEKYSIVDNYINSIGTDKGYILDQEKLLEKTNNFLETIETIPTTYNGFIKIANDLNSKIYNSIEEIMLSFQLKYGADFPEKKDRFIFNPKNINGKSYDLAMSMDKFDADQFTKMYFNLTEKKNGIKQPLTSIAQFEKYHKDFFRVVHHAQDMINKWGVDAFMEIE